VYKTQLLCSLSFIIGFILVFRTTLANNRYTEGNTAIQAMSANWFAVASAACNFKRISSDAQRHVQTGFKDVSPVTSKQQYQAFAEHLAHLLTLMHALCLQALRGDNYLSNLEIHSEFPPFYDAAGLDYHTKPALVDCFVLRDNLSAKLEYNAATKMPVLPSPTCPYEVLSTEERLALGADKEAQATPQMETTFVGEDVPDMQICEPAKRRGILAFLGSLLQHHQGMVVQGAMERPYTIFTWVQAFLISQMRTDAGWTAIAPPTSAFLLPLLNSGLTAYERGRRIMEVPFPFPFSQLCVLLLLIHTITAPVLMVAWVSTLWLACVLTFFSVLTFWALNEVARELEDPFVFPPNDLPLQRLQWNFVQRVRAASSAVETFVAHT
jgi:predicted membrane chloride channel (bestrophin family)